MPQVGFHLLRRFETHDDALVLRRYVPHSRFVSLIETSALYFAPASAFSNKKEGHYTNLDDDASDRQLARWGLDARARAIAADARSTVARDNQRAIVITCWTASIDESPRMWSEYGRGPDAVALETTVGRLRRALGSAFLIVPVTYLDFSRDTIPREHSLQPFFFKQSSFAWEREVGVVTEMEESESASKLPVSHPLILDPCFSKSSSRRTPQGAIARPSRHYLVQHQSISRFANLPSASMQPNPSCTGPSAFAPGFARFRGPVIFSVSGVAGQPGK